MKHIKLLLLFFMLMLLANASFSANDTTITTFNKVHQGFGGGLNRTEVDTFIFPSAVTDYDTILMHVILDCPTGGCDPWDRLAYIQLIDNNYSYEIGRYITPYGKACSWAIDVSDYRSYLTDTVIISSFIDTWVNPAWLVTINFEFKTGVPAYQFTSVEKLWENYYLVYGDTSKPINIEEVIKDIPAAEKVILKIFNTGHGQGNTNNAAEFSKKTHTIFINDDSTFAHYLWRDNCASNSCSPQNGTWQYNRAGWCPGADAQSATYDITSLINTGAKAKVLYQFQDYTNQCSPNYGGCVEGVTCSDCDYNYNGHTEPYYAFAGQLIYYSNTKLSIQENKKNHPIVVFPNPVKNQLNINLISDFSKKEITILDIQGRVLIKEIFPKSSSKIILDISHFNKGLYLLKIVDENSVFIERIIKN